MTTSEPPQIIYVDCEEFNLVGHCSHNESNSSIMSLDSEDSESNASVTFLKILNHAPDPLFMSVDNKDEVSVELEIAVTTHQDDQISDMSKQLNHFFEIQDTKLAKTKESFNRKRRQNFLDTIEKDTSSHKKHQVIEDDNEINDVQETYRIKKTLDGGNDIICYYQPKSDWESRLLQKFGDDFGTCEQSFFNKRMNSLKAQFDFDELEMKVAYNLRERLEKLVNNNMKYHAKRRRLLIKPDRDAQYKIKIAKLERENQALKTQNKDLHKTIDILLDKISNS